MDRTPFTFTLRTAGWYTQQRLYIDGKARRDGIAALTELPISEALSVVYSYLIDEASYVGEVTVAVIRERIDEVLNEPADPIKAEQWKRERWGWSSEARAAAEVTARANVPVYGES